MTITRLLTVSMAALALAAAVPCFAQDARCAACGMKVDLESRFASKIVQGEKTLLFCDVGDLLGFLDGKSALSAAARVRDHGTGEWIRAEDAFYVRSEKAFRTPMRWSIAAFENRQDAAAHGAPMDLASALKAVR
jgi:hypothetical protein